MDTALWHSCTATILSQLIKVTPILVRRYHSVRQICKNQSRPEASNFAINSSWFRVTNSLERPQPAITCSK